MYRRRSSHRGACRRLELLSRALAQRGFALAGNGNEKQPLRDIQSLGSQLSASPWQLKYATNWPFTTSRMPTRHPLSHFIRAKTICTAADWWWTPQR